MIKIITKKKYNEMVARLKELEFIKETQNDSSIYGWLEFDKEKEKTQKYQKLYLDELNKRLKLAEIVRRIEKNENCNL